MYLYITYAETVACRTERFTGPSGVNVTKDIQKIDVEFLHAFAGECPDTVYYETVTIRDADECGYGDTVYVPIVRYAANDGAQSGRWCIPGLDAFMMRSDAEAALMRALDPTYSRCVRPWEGLYERFENACIVAVKVV